MPIKAGAAITHGANEYIPVSSSSSISRSLRKTQRTGCRSSERFRALIDGGVVALELSEIAVTSRGANAAANGARVKLSGAIDTTFAKPHEPSVALREHHEAMTPNLNRSPES
jgi:hypothetical protein